MRELVLQGMMLRSNIYTLPTTSSKLRSSALSHNDAALTIYVRDKVQMLRLSFIVVEAGHSSLIWEGRRERMNNWLRYRRGEWHISKEYCTIGSKSWMDGVCALWLVWKYYGRSGYTAVGLVVVEVKCGDSWISRSLSCPNNQNESNKCDLVDADVVVKVVDCVDAEVCVEMVVEVVCTMMLRKKLRCNE